MTSIIAGKQVAVSYEEESEVPLKVGVSFAIFVLSFFGMSPHLSTIGWAHILGHSCIVSGNLKTSTISTHTLPCLLHWQAFWYRGHPVHSIRPFTAGLLQRTQLAMDWIHNVSLLVATWIVARPVLRKLRRLASLLSIFLVECSSSWFIVPSE